MSLKKSIRRHLLEMVTEGMDPSGLPDHKYYAFDWDDNVMNMPTNIMILDDKDNEIVNYCNLQFENLKIWFL